MQSWKSSKNAESDVSETVQILAPNLEVHSTLIKCNSAHQMIDSIEPGGSVESWTVSWRFIKHTHALEGEAKREPDTDSSWYQALFSPHEPGF